MLLSPSRLRPSLLSSLYIALLALRTYSALAGHAYIHPDEWFQSGEPLTAHLFGLDTLRTWEFDPAFPCRSMASIQLFNWPLVIYAKLLYPETTPEPATLFRIQRLTFLVWSLGLDYAAYTLTQPRHRLRTLCLLASSSSVLAFQVRPFSNAVEAVTLALSLVALKHSRQSIAWATILGVVAAAGLFSRFTFPIFFLPVGLSFLFQSPFSRILTAAAGFLVTSLAHILYDTHHFTGTLSFHHIIIAPLNAFVYNVRTSNVVLHGVHPRWLHTAVNLPLIVGVGALLALPRASRCGGSFSARVLAAVLVTALLGLSISPHQEPRFLLPLVLPAVLLVGRSPVPRILLVLYLAQHAVQLAFFGFAHQAGLVPALLSVSSPRTVAFCRTFMPPRHLLPPDSHVLDAGSDCAEARASGASHLVAPAWAAHSLGLPLPASFLPSIDTDHLAETLAIVPELGLRAAFSLNLYQLG